MHDIQGILKNYWGYDAFRPLQEDIIRSVLSGRDTLALLPTGGGKSICFQVPALALPGICLVVSPLIALMKDQVEQLRKRNITAFAIYSGMSRSAVINVLNLAAESNCKFLYVSPERLETFLFREHLPLMDISLLAVDESHCISQWGYDFRPSYLRIAALREDLPDVPVLALTASATPMVQEDIMEKLQFRGRQLFRQSFERPNLSYSVFRSESKINRIITILQKVQGSGIVYCKSRRRTREISDLLNMQGINSGYYHAGLTQEERNTRQEAWIKNELRIIVCTNAFGMGIDKPDVRIVVHADVPDCLENYYQEAGRAGRDGKRSYAVLLYTDEELNRLREMPEIRFPPLEKVREVYRALVNYLQIPVHGGAGEYFPFDLNTFIATFQLDSNQAVHSLKALEQEEFITLNEQVFLPSTVQFICGRKEIIEFQQLHPQSDPLIKTLLRTYEGIFDQPVFIIERAISVQLRKNDEDIIAGLQLLHRAGIIDYQPKKDKPQVYFTSGRVRPEDLHFREGRYAERKKLFTERIETMIAYIHDGACRSRFSARYFGDNTVKDCGICDNCLEHKRKRLSTTEFDSIFQQLSQLIRTGYMSLEALDRQLAPASPRKIREVIRFMQQENRISVNDQGEIRLKQRS